MIPPEPWSPIFQQPPQESTGPEVSGPVGQTTASVPPAATSALGEDIGADMQPLRIQLGGCQASLPMPG